MIYCPPPYQGGARGGYLKKALISPHFPKGEINNFKKTRHPRIKTRHPRMLLAGIHPQNRFLLTPCRNDE